MLKRVKSFFLECRMQINEMRQKIKRAIPKGMKGALAVLGCVLLCGIIVEGIAKVLPVLAAHKLILGVMSGRWIYPLVEKLLNKVLRR